MKNKFVIQRPKSPVIPIMKESKVDISKNIQITEEVQNQEELATQRISTVKKNTDPQNMTNER